MCSSLSAEESSSNSNRLWVVSSSFLVLRFLPKSLLRRSEGRLFLLLLLCSCHNFSSMIDCMLPLSAVSLLSSHSVFHFFFHCRMYAEIETRSSMRKLISIYIQIKQIFFCRHGAIYCVYWRNNRVPNDESLWVVLA